MATQMPTTQIQGPPPAGPRHAARQDPAVPSAAQVPTMRSVPASLVMLGVVIALVAAWGGVVAYVGPSFGFSGDGSAAWRWTASHLFLALLPGAVAFVAGLLLMVIAPRTIDGRGRADLFLLGSVTVLCGAWFTAGPAAWPVIRAVHPYFVAAPPFRTLTVQLGYSVGPGLLLVACGGMAIGWGIRHQRPIAPLYPAFVAVPTTAPVLPGPPAGDPGTTVGWPAQPQPQVQPEPQTQWQPVVAVPGQVDDPTLTGAVPTVRPVPTEPTERAWRSTRPVPLAPAGPGPWPSVPPPGPARPGTPPPMGWRSPDVTGPVEQVERFPGPVERPSGEDSP